MRFISLLLLLITLSLPVMAQDLIIVPDVENKEPAIIAAEDLQSDPAHLQNSLTFYDRCISLIYTDFSAQTHKSFCACAAENARKKLNSKEIQTLARGKGVELSPATVHSKALGTCMGLLVRDTEYNKFINSRAAKDLFKTPEALFAAARCVSEGMQAFMETYGEDAMAQVDAMTSQPKDPLTDLLGSYLYKSELAKIRGNCMNSYAYQ